MLFFLQNRCITKIHWMTLCIIKLLEKRLHLQLLLYTKPWPHIKVCLDTKQPLINYGTGDLYGSENQCMSENVLTILRKNLIVTKN